jgi:hypothetical protein
MEGIYLNEQSAAVIGGYQRVSSHIDLVLFRYLTQPWQARIFAKRGGGFSDHRHHKLLICES